jgi:hypothetical protein
MMRPANAAGVIVAEFDAPETPFALEEVIWAIGGKWEQQYMGHDGQGETLLPGAWHGATRSWQVVGWDGWNQPVPRERCHGCHTVGLDPETGTFVEPNIGCESCHGPSDWHVETLGLGRVTSLSDAEVCGQCHARGRHPSGRLHFPSGYRPGKRLLEHFTLDEPPLGQNASDWWGNGRARSRHQEFTEWRRGGHANALKSLREGYDGRFGAVNDDCLRCHSGDYIRATDPRPTLDEARDGITCSVCHNVHGSLDQERMTCSSCHGNGAFYHEPERSEGHVPCPPSANVQCTNCHMPKTVVIGGAYQLASHAPGVIEPSDAAAWGMPTSCSQGSCHANTAPGDLQTVFDRVYRSE